MCNRRLTATWEAALPSTTKLVLAYVSNRAQDDGTAFFLVGTAAKQCSLSDRAVQKALASLEEAGYLVRDVRPGRSTVFRVLEPSVWPQEEDDPRTTFTPEPHSPPNVVHPRTSFTPEPGSPTPERGSPPPEPRSPISTTKALPNHCVSGAGAREDAQVLATNVLAAQAMVRAGIAAREVNFSHADLVVLAEQVPVREFELAAGQAVAAGKGFAYALGIVKGRAADGARGPPEKTRTRTPPPNADFKGQTYAGTSLDQLSPAMREHAERMLAGRAGAEAV